MSPGLVEPALRRTLTDMQLNYLDLYVMHWPMAFEVMNRTRLLCYIFQSKDKI